MDLNAFKKTPVMGIVRGTEISDITPLIETVIRSGLQTIEITMNTRDAVSIISEAVSVSQGRISIGAGTVLSDEDLEKALSAGAEFVVMPVCDEKVVKTCAKNKIPVFPGAITPSEVLRAWSYGASMVKIFPSSFYGPKYFKALKGPLDKIELMAVGGVNLKNIKEYFDCGAGAVAFGASIFKKDLLAKKDFRTIGRLVKDFVETVKRASNR